MSDGERTGHDRLRGLPHMTEEHLAVLEEEGLDAPERLLPVLKDEDRWSELHPRMKGIGPKTVEKWILALEEQPESKVVKVERRLKVKASSTTTTASAAEAEPEREEKAAKEPEAELEPETLSEAELAEVEPEEPLEEEEEEGAEEELESEAEEEEEEEAEVEIVEEGVYVPKPKATLTPELKDALQKRDRISRRRPAFLRQEYHRYKRLRTGWRKPRGRHSKARKRLRYRVNIVSAGYGGPRLARGLHPSGFEEVRVHNVADLERISEPERQAARIAHGVGQRKRAMIIERADELGIRILNRS